VQSESFEIPTWEQIYTMLLDLADKIRGYNSKFDLIVGVSRGGWTPARVLSDLLENPQIANVKAEFYLGVSETKREPIITQPISVNVEGKKVLVVDDVSDTGESLRLVKEHLLKQGACILKIASIYVKPWSITIPDFYQKITSAWIIFPWERREAFRKVAEKFTRSGKSVEEAKDTLIKSGFDSDLATRWASERESR